MTFDRTGTHVSEAKSALLDAARSGGLSGLLQAVGNAFDSPALLVDECFRLIASTAPPGGGSEAWDRILDARELDPEAIWHSLKGRRTESSGFYKPFYEERGLVGGAPMLMAELVWSSNILGHLVVYLHRPVQSGDLELMDAAAYLLAVHLSRNDRGMEQWSHTMAAQLQLLLTESTPPHLLQEAVRTLSARLKGRYAVMVTPVGGQPTQRAFAGFAVRRLQQTCPNTVAMIYENSIVTLMGEAKYHPTDPILRPENNELVARLFDYFRQYTLKSGLSSSFQDLDQLRMYYRQALLSARLANQINLEAPAVFIELMPLPLFAAALESEPDRTFFHPVFLQIRAYDQEHGTEYERTLRTYALCMRNKEEAAQQLSIHKNTLKYRLERIEELFHLPLDDEWTALNLLCTALLLEVAPGLGDRSGGTGDAPASQMTCSGPILKRRAEGRPGER